MKEKIKPFQVRLKKSLWDFLKDAAAEREVSMNTIIAECVEKYQKKCERKFDKY